MEGKKETGDVATPQVFSFYPGLTCCGQECAVMIDIISPVFFFMALVGA